MLYDEENIIENFDNLLKTDTYIKCFMGEKHKPVYKDDKMISFVKNNNEVIIVELDEYIDNKEYYHENFEIIRIHHLTEPQIKKCKELSIPIKYKQRLFNIIKHIDGNYLEFNGKDFRVERWNRNHYDKAGFQVETTFRKIEDVLELLSHWDKFKRSTGTLMTFTGYDKSFFKNYYEENKKKYDLLTLFFYDNDKLIAFQVMEKTSDDFWILHTRKTDRFNYPNLNLYVDIYTFRKIWEEYGIPFYVNMGFEGYKKMTDYKIKRFTTHSRFESYYLKLETEFTKEKTKEKTVNSLF